MGGFSKIALLEGLKFLFVVLTSLFHNSYSVYCLFTLVSFSFHNYTYP